MSNLMSQARSRVPRSAWAAVERARLSVVPVRRSRAPRMPFAILVSLVLATGVVGLLMFNTQMQQASFHAASLQEKADSLTAQRQALAMELEALRDPQRVAQRARRLGMVAPSVPAFIRLSDGRIIGAPAPATPEDAVPIHGAPAVKPSSLDPAPLVITVHPRDQRSGATSQTGRGGTNGATAPASEGASR
ncbi:MAG TPA: septum formation initiator family protein [Marmoricola sp.]|nr:septum formation initiator family protein [Marmoricola sp.]